MRNIQAKLLEQGALMESDQLRRLTPVRELDILDTSMRGNLLALKRQTEAHLGVARAESR
jgi:hypothetical protein